MATVIRSPQADADIFELGVYIAQRNPAAAERFLDRIDRKLEELARYPGFGRLREELAPNLRSAPVGKYLLFYRPVQNGIELVRLVHGARDLRRLFDA